MTSMGTMLYTLYRYHSYLDPLFVTTRSALKMPDKKQMKDQINILTGEPVAHDQIINILESFTDGFIALDKEWRYTYINREVDKYLKTRQRTRLDLIGKRIWDEFPHLKETLLYKEY